MAEGSHELCVMSTLATGAISNSVEPVTPVGGVLPVPVAITLALAETAMVVL